MRIRQHHLWHGAALQQIAEYHEFTAINRIDGGGRCAYLINDKIPLWVKYRSESPYHFTFTLDDQRKIETLYERYNDQIWIALVCGKLREICLLSYYQYRTLWNGPSRAFSISVWAEHGKCFRVRSGRQELAKTIPKNAFPRKLFGR